MPLDMPAETRRGVVFNRAINVRVSEDIYARLKARLARDMALRAEAERSGNRFRKRMAESECAANISDVFRDAVAVGLEILEGEYSRLRSYFYEVAKEDLESILARSVDPDKARAELENHFEPDFG